MSVAAHRDRRRLHILAPSGRGPPRRSAAAARVRLRLPPLGTDQPAPGRCGPKALGRAAPTHSQQQNRSGSPGPGQGHPLRQETRLTCAPCAYVRWRQLVDTADDADDADPATAAAQRTDEGVAEAGPWPAVGESVHVCTGPAPRPRPDSAGPAVVSDGAPHWPDQPRIRCRGMR